MPRADPSHRNGTKLLDRMVCGMSRADPSYPSGTKLLGRMVWDVPGIVGIVGTRLL